MSPLKYSCTVAADVTSDLLEQQQAREQTRLLDRFKQLRDWQAQQQELLMKRQEQQLAQFHSEQEKLQQLILRQRNAHWGSNPTPPQHNGMSIGSPTLHLHITMVYPLGLQPVTFPD